MGVTSKFQSHIGLHEVIGVGSGRGGGGGGAQFEFGTMASYRNGRGTVKVDRAQPTGSSNLRTSSSFKSKNSIVRRSNSSAGFDDSGEF